MVRSVRRTLGFVSFGAPLLMVVTVSACTGGESDASPSTVARIGATNYVTQPMVTLLTTTVPGATLLGGGTAPPGRQYRVRAGDAVSAIAARYGISGDELADYNDWENGTAQMIIPGDVIEIPPFADIPADEAVTTLGDEMVIFEGPMCPDGTERETYEVETGDYLSRVADDLDVSVEALDEANVGTPGYRSFYPGLEILVPCPADDIDQDGPASSPDTTVN